MKPLGRRLPRGAAIALVAMLALMASVGVARAGHTLPDPGGGDCWRPGTPLWCRTTWITTHDIRLRLVNQFTNERPGWYANASAACDAWHNYRLPPAGQPDIWCHWGAVYNDTLVYEVWANPPLPSGVLARTYNCNTSGVCTALSTQSLNVWYSVIHMNMSAIDTLSSDQRTFMFAHEMGHTLGLWHHANVLMNAAVLSSPLGPTATDYGQLPPCSGAATTYGVRCVFNIPN